MWAVCVACHHHAEVKPWRKTATLKCTACGSRVARSVRRIKPTMLNGGQVGSDEARVLTYAGLLSIAKERGYKTAWAAMKFKQIYAVYPDAEVPLQNPSAELVWWIKKQNIEYAKAHFPRETPKPKPTVEDSRLMTAEDWDADL